MSKPRQTAPDGKKRLTDFFIVQAWLVLLLASFFGAALAGIQLTLEPKIAANKLNETLEKVPELILGTGAAQALKNSGKKMEINREFMEGGKKTYSVFQAETKGSTDGWVIKAAGQGYGDKIELLIGLDANAKTITGLYIIDQKETPGLGNNIVKPDWRNQFIDKSAEHHLTAVKTKASAPYEINAITGATISSRSVCDIVNQSLDNLRRPLAKAVSNNEKPSDNQQEKK